jgi:hypothetical protein
VKTAEATEERSLVASREEREVVVVAEWAEHDLVTAGGVEHVATDRQRLPEAGVRLAEPVPVRLLDQGPRSDELLDLHAHVPERLLQRHVEAAGRPRTPGEQRRVAQEEELVDRRVVRTEPVDPGGAEHPLREGVLALRAIVHVQPVLRPRAVEERLDPMMDDVQELAHGLALALVLLERDVLTEVGEQRR